MRAISLLLATLLIANVAAQNPEDYGDYDDYDQNYMSGWCDEQGVNADADGKELTYTICRAAGGPNGGSMEIVEVSVDLGNDASIAMEGMSARGNNQGGSVLAFEYDLSLLQVVEFVDDGDGKYVPGDDEIVKTQSLNGGWSTIRTAESNDGLTYEADHPLNGGGTFTLAGKATGSSYSANGVSVKPLDTKIDFIFSDITYSNPDSQLALVLHLESEDFGAQGTSFGSGGHVVQSGEAGVVGSKGATSLYFTWANTADVDGIAKPVTHHIDILDSESHGSGGDGNQATFSESEAGITLAYERGTEIIHDPRLGVQFDVGRDSPGLPFVFVLAAFAIMVARRR